MTYYVTDGRSVSTSTAEYATIEAALEAARAPAYEGAKANEITMLADNKYKHMGTIYTIVEGRNPRLIRDEAASAPASNRIAFNESGKFRGSRWLSREMDSADSDF